jgi:hypothetical protein
MVAAMNFDSLVAVLAVAAAVPLILTAVPLVPVPGPVLEIVAGIVLGPAGASLGELSPVILLSLFFSGRTTAIGSKLLLLSLLGVLVVLVVIGTLRIERSMWITRMINRLADTSAQIRIRLSILLVVGLGALATHLGFEAILGVTSGLTFNLSVLFSNASTLLRVPLFLLALLVVRGLPAALYRSALASFRDVAAAGLLQATSLPFIVAATAIGLQLHAIRPANAAALVTAGLFSVILFPIISLQLLRSPASPGPRVTGSSPEA